MPHYPRPYYRAKRGTWYVQIGKTEHTLGKDKDEAFRLYHQLMGREPEERQLATPATITAAEVIDRFLEWASKNREPLTYKAYKQRLQYLIDSIPITLPCNELKPYHLTSVMDAQTWNPNTKNDFATAVQRAFNWAVKQGLIDHNPVAYVEKPGRQARELVVTPQDYADVMAKVEEPNFRMLLELAWETGARVQELRKIEAHHFDSPNNRVVFPPREAKGKKHHRVIYLTERAKEIIAELADRNPDGPVLRNSEGAPWTKDAINCAFCRLKKKIGRKLHLGAWRKGYATEALKAGIDVIGLAHLMGHRDPTMLSKVYAKVQQDPEYMATLSKKAKRPTS